MFFSSKGCSTGWVMFCKRLENKNEARALHWWLGGKFFYHPVTPRVGLLPLNIFILVRAHSTCSTTALEGGKKLVLVLCRGKYPCRRKAWPHQCFYSQMFPVKCSWNWNTTERGIKTTGHLWSHGDTRCYFPSFELPSGTAVPSPRKISLSAHGLSKTTAGKYTK